ncbi:hypothetical protein GCM10023321_73030 [Pseudonocardia eucalypti]|uniref:DhaL domain-containing protein n=1 Tax=Pseudonocardia eucalypti TaxID=648755 RepID=A0ABP9R837_9PSEU|nr:dihydroxyacetone kinase-like protein [Pseudonocardia eucalypti]
MSTVERTRQMTLDEALAWIDRFATHVQKAKVDFTELDRRAGDGDFGTNVDTALVRARQKITERPPDTAGGVMHRVSAGFLTTGGTCGPLLGAWFRELGKHLAEGATTEAFAAGVRAATEKVQRLGKAQVGDRTMVDAMVPAADALATAAALGTGLTSALADAADAARRGAESTAELLGRRGRASYVGEAAHGSPDPGAVLIADLFVTAIPQHA